MGIITNQTAALYVANSLGGPDGLGSVTIYPTGSTGNATPTVTISGSGGTNNTGLNFPTDLAFDASGNLYVTNAYGGPDGYGSVTIYAPGFNGNVAPVATISDNPSCAACDNTGLTFPYGIAIDPAGKIYVANVGGGPDTLGSVTIYAALGSSTGTLNEAPTATIAGASIGNNNTGLSFPSSIALDSAANIYVTNDGSLNGGADSITIYSAGSKGNVTPSSTITGSNTGLANPQGIAISWNAGVMGGIEPAAKLKPSKRKRGELRK